MFFRREKPKLLAFAGRLEAARQLGFAVEPRSPGSALVSRERCAAVVEDAGELPRLGKEGILIGGEMGLLVDGGFQKFFETPGGKRVPALAAELSALHAFDEDLREALGLPSLYNQSLGTTCELHVYDRLDGRE